MIFNVILNEVKNLIPICLKYFFTFDLKYH